MAERAARFDARDQASPGGPGVLLVDGGDLPSLVAIGLESDPSRLVLWHARGSDAAAGRRLEVVRAHAQTFGARRLIVLEPSDAARRANAPLALLAEASLLVQAIAAAVEHGCTKLIWPAHLGPDFESVAQRFELAAQVTRVADAALGRPAPLIDLPIVDLTDYQLADLADDSGVPVRGFWPCDTAERQPCESCGGCERWKAAFHGAGLQWPWAKAAAA